VALSDNLIAYWSLDEASGNAIDAHSTHDLTDTNTVGAATGKVNGARDFERGNTEVFSIADNDDLSVGDIAFSIAAWVQLESKFADEMVIACKSSAGNGDWFLHYNDGLDRFQFQVFTAGGFGGSATANADNLGSPSTATWYFVVAWHDPTANTINICVNDGTVNSTSHSGGVGDFASTIFHIGGDPFANYWDGLIDEVGFWKKVLSASEITELYNAGSGRDYDYIINGGGATPTGYIHLPLMGVG
jgi:hypothetical protein